MKKIYFSILSVILLSIGAQAQNTTKGVVFTTGGSYAAPGNLVKLYAMETQNFSSWTVDSLPGDFSNHVVVESHFAYVHVGRAAGNPAGLDKIYKYDILDGDQSSPIDSTLGMGGIQKFEISGDRIIISKGYPSTTNLVEVVDKNNMQTSLFSDNSIMGGCAGITIMNNMAYVASTDYVMNSGVVHVINLGTSISNDGSILLDSLSIGAGQIYSENGMIYLTNKRFRPDYSTWYAGVTELNLTDSTFTTDTTGLTAATGFDFYNNMILGNFGAPLETYDVATGTRTPVFADYCTAAKKDPNGDHYAVQNTDYTTIGSVTIYDGNGIAMGMANSDISGSALAVVTNNAPTAVNDTVVHNLGSLPNLSPFNIDVLFNDFDIDGDSLMIDTVLSSSAMIVGNEIEYDPSMNGVAADTFIYVTTDVWGDVDTASVYLNFVTGIDEVQHSFYTKVFPNPANEMLNISTESGSIEKVEIIDLGGRIVITAVSTKIKETINVSELNTGVYFVKVSINGNVETHRLIIQ